MIILVQGNRRKGKWTKTNQHGPSQAKSSLRTNPLKKNNDHSRQRGSTLYCFYSPPTQKIFGVGHMTIAYLLVDVSGMYLVFFS